MYSLQCSPVEGVGLRDGPVQTAGCSVANELEQKHHAVIRVLGNGQVDAFPRLGGNLNDGITNSATRQEGRRNVSMLNIVNKIYKNKNFWVSNAT